MAVISLLTTPMIFIYKVINEINGAPYVGQTRQILKERFDQHLKPSNHCIKLRNAMNKYGRENFSIHFIMVVNTQEVACYWERFFITKLDSIKNGYNISPGGLVFYHTEETKEKLRIANTGKVHSDETKEKCRQATLLLRGSVDYTPELRKKFSDVQKGKKQPEETKQKRSQALTGQKRSEQQRQNLINGARKKLAHRTPEATLDILTSPLSPKELGKKYGCGADTISKIRREARPPEQRQGHAFRPATTAETRKRISDSKKAGRKHRTPEAVADIMSSKLPAKELAAKYECNIDAIRRVRNGK